MSSEMYGNNLLLDIDCESYIFVWDPTFLFVEIRYSDAVNRSEREYNDENVREKKDKLWTVKHYTLKAKD
jgi:hypothetical protein